VEKRLFFSAAGFEPGFERASAIASASNHGSSLFEKPR
jgi:hypothetical protein